MAGKVVRGQLALETGDRLQELGKHLLKLHEFNGDALEVRRATIITALNSQAERLLTLLRSCRAAKNSYPNYPALRKVLTNAGEQVYELSERLSNTISEFSLGGADAVTTGHDLLTLGQELKLIEFVLPTNETHQA
jgi:hypothetical protein